MKKKLIRLPESYQAAHSIPKKITTALGLDHESQLTMHTIKEANAKTSYDNLLVNLYNFVKSNSLPELLTSNLDLGKKTCNF